MQLELPFPEISTPRTTVWQALAEAERRSALDVLARLIAQAARPEPSPENPDDD